MSVTRFVKSDGGTSGTFISQASPAKTVALALKAASPGDTIAIMDAATYVGPELLVDKPVTITSSYLLAHPNLDPTAPDFDHKLLPSLSGDGRSRVVRVQGTRATRKTLGPMTISGLRIRNGHATHLGTDPGLGCGGGVVIVDADQVTVDRCIFTGNRTEAAPVQSWPESDRLALRQAIMDLLGDIFAPTTEKLLNGMIDLVNGILKTAIPHVSRATVLAKIGADFDGKIGPGRPNHAISGQAFGGAVATVWASPTITRCLIKGNTANGRGGGIAVTGYGWPTISECVVDQNSTLTVLRRDGGGIGCEVAIPSKLGRDLFENSLVRFLVSKVGVVRQRVQSPLPISMSDLLAYAIWLANPQGLNPLGSGVKALVLDVIHWKWAEAKDHALYYFVSTVLSTSAGDAWEVLELAAAKTTAITIKDCRVTRNHAYDDGGGLYASVLSRLSLSRVAIRDNKAENMGGGARLTMGAAAEIRECTFTGNAAGPGGKQGHDKGGGVAARNVDLTMSDCLIGAKGQGGGSAASPASNLVGDAPGGGMAFEAVSEGAMSGIPDLWTSILVHVFGVTSVTVHLGKGCFVGSNGAGYGGKGQRLSRAEHAKGGGLFVIRGTFPDAPKLTLLVDAAKSTIRGNRAASVNYKSAVQDGLKVGTANEVALQDLVTKKEYTETNWSVLIDSSGTLKF